MTSNPRVVYSIYIPTFFMRRCTVTWFNYYGLIVVVIIMIPNIVYAIKHTDSAPLYHNTVAEIFEQVGRYACMALMVFNLPYTWFGFYFPYAKVVYIAVNTLLVFAYCLIWVLLWNRDGLLKSLLLSILPSCVFLFSGAIIASIPLVVFAIVFAATHIFISVKNTPQPPEAKSIPNN